MPSQPRANSWRLPAGETQIFQITLTKADGSAIVGQYTGTETIGATVWEGSNLAPIPSVVFPQWLDAANGVITVTVTPPAAMTAGFYRVKLSVVYAGATSPFYLGWLQVDPVAGTGTAPAVYCTLQHLLDRSGGWLARLMQEGAGDECNFLAERAMARAWLDDVIVGASRVDAYGGDLAYGLTTGSFPFGPVESPDSVLQGYLAADMLLIVPRTIECVAYKALGYICEKRSSFDETGEQYRQRAAYYHRKASNSLRSYRPCLDTDGDGTADIAFNLGIVSFR
jgi:hypothetical protein